MNFDLVVVCSEESSLADFQAVLFACASETTRPDSICFVGGGSGFGEALAEMERQRRDDLVCAIYGIVAKDSSSYSEALNQSLGVGSALEIVVGKIDEVVGGGRLGLALSDRLEAEHLLTVVGSKRFATSIQINPLLGGLVAFPRTLLGRAPGLFPATYETILETLLLSLMTQGVPEVLTSEPEAEALGRASHTDAVVGTPQSLGVRYVDVAPRLSIVVPTLDASQPRVRNLLRSLREHTVVPYEIILVDNGNAPQGFSLPVNSGIRAASGEFVVVVNDDVVVSEYWWEPLEDALLEGAKVVFPSTREGTRLDFSAWCFGFRSSDLLELSHTPGNFFDPNLRIWFQDSDLYLRLCDADEPPVLVAHSVVSHAFSETLRTPDAVISGWIRSTIDADQRRFRATWGDEGLHRIGFVDNLAGVLP